MKKLIVVIALSGCAHLQGADARLEQAMQRSCALACDAWSAVARHERESLIASIVDGLDQITSPQRVEIVNRYCRTQTGIETAKKLRSRVGALRRAKSAAERDVCFSCGHKGGNDQCVFCKAPR